MTYIIHRYAGTKKSEKSITGCYAYFEKVCCRDHLLPTVDWLTKYYNIKPTDKLRVMHIKYLNRKYSWNGRGWNKYRTKFKHIFYGTLEEFAVFCRKHYEEKNWSKKRGTPVPCPKCGEIINSHWRKHLQCGWTTYPTPLETKDENNK